MAEIVGLIASGISIVEVAAKVGGHVLAIKKLWDEIKDVPHTLQSLTDEIGLLSSVLHDLEADSDTAHSDAQSPSDNARGQTIEYCRIALDDLEGVAAELITQINSSKRFKRSTAKVKVVLRRGIWEKIEQRLQKITRILGLAQQCYLLALMKKQPTVLVSHLESLGVIAPLQPEKISDDGRATAGQDDGMIPTTTGRLTLDAWKWNLPAANWLRPSFFGALTFHNQFDQTLSARKVECSSQYYLQLRAPSWLTRKAWDIQASKNVYSGFKFHLRTYSIVPENAPVLICARNGDINGLLDLFAKKLASPFDRDIYGETLIHAALHHGKVEAVVEMTNWGLDLAQIFDPSSGLWSWISLSTRLLDHNKLRALHEFALSKKAYDEYADKWLEEHPFRGQSRRLFEDLTRLVMSCGLSEYPEAMRLMLPFLRPGHYQLSAKDRLSFFAFQQYGAHPNSLRFVLRADGEICSEDIEELAQQGVSLLRCIATTYRNRPTSDYRRSPLWQKWRELTREIMSKSRNLHCQHACDSYPFTKPVNCVNSSSVPQDTPMLSVINSPLWPVFPRSFSGWRRGTEEALRDWTEDLQISKIDLSVYGKMERKLLLEGKDANCLCYSSVIDNSGCCSTTWRLEDFKYGPKPQDWRFYWDLGVEALVADFWYMVENPPLHVVGEWVEDV